VETGTEAKPVADSDVAIVIKKIKKASPGKVLIAEDQLAIEEPLEIQLVFGEEEAREKKVISVTMRTPGNDEELALGFLFTEGVIHNRRQLKENISSTSNSVIVHVKAGEKPILRNADRNFYTTSSCGVCGKTSIEAIRSVSAYTERKDDILVDSTSLYRLPEQLLKQQTLFRMTGGLHASALLDVDGNFRMLREDVGRHNALDKLIGAAFKDDALPLDRNILLLSGRASFELIQKASMAGIRIVAAVGAPSSLAVELAEQTGMTLIGFLRHNSFNVYAGAHRLQI
jgi:FdhD protein